MDEHQHDWDKRREELSALLDGELAPEARAELLAHLARCAACRAELESLRRVSNLLGALPQPALPRSFALPLEPVGRPAWPVVSAPVPTGAGASAGSPTPQGAPGLRAARPRRPVQVLRWLSTVAAVLGLLLLLSGAFSQVHLSNGAVTTSAPAAYQSGGARPGATPPIATTPKAQTPENTPAAGAATQAPTSAAAPTAGSATPVPPTAAPTDGSTPPPATGPTSLGGFHLDPVSLGLILLSVGLVGIIVAAVLRRRWSHA